jgi:hypothetical protein
VSGMVPLAVNGPALMGVVLLGSIVLLAILLRDP